MKTTPRSVAAIEAVLIFPAALFLFALVIRSLQPQQYEPARTAQSIVNWYAARPHVGLWLLLMALPLVVFAVGCVTLLRNWQHDAKLRQAAHSALAALRNYCAIFFDCRCNPGFRVHPFNRRRSRVGGLKNRRCRHCYFAGS